MINVFLRISFFCSFFSFYNYSYAHEVDSLSTHGNSGLTFSHVVKQTSPSVVNIYTSKLIKQRRPTLFNDPFFQRFFGGNLDDSLGLSRERIENSLGSGVIVRADGIIVTNNHVIDGADRITVVLADRREFDASIVGTDKRTDIAVLRIITPPKNLPVLNLEVQDNIDVGDIVFAIGNPFGVGQTVTSGIVSALARSNIGVSDFRSFIQTDAAINPGNSGGALVSIDGNLVGINTAIFSQDGGNVGIGFAIPTVMVKVVVGSILKDGRAIRGWLGAKGQTITSEIADALGLERPIGVIVNKVYDLSPAKKSGIRVGDILLSVNGNDIIDSNNLSYLLATVEVGSKTNLIILRDNIQKNIDIILIPPPERPLRNVKNIEQNIPPFGGIKIANLNPALAEELGVETQEGVIVLSIIRRSFARQIGLLPGDLIIQVNGKKIEKVSDFLKVISKQDREWVFTFNRGGKLIQRSVGL